MKQADRRHAPASSSAKAKTISIALMASVNNPPFGRRRVDFFVAAHAPKRIRVRHLSDSVNFPIFKHPSPVLNPATP
jgi:hypothetical protein